MAVGGHAPPIETETQTMNQPQEFNPDLDSGIAAFEAKHFNTAMPLLRPLAEEGNAEAQFRVAIMYQNGLGIVANEQKAFEFMKAAAEAGHALAQHGLGFMYLEGECVEKDEAQAAAWFERAGEQGLTGSLATLAQMYMEGRGVPQDEAKARELYQQAGFDPDEF